MLEIRGLTKYFGGLAAISDLDMDIKQGELLGLIGPNGAGKTTAFNLITGFSQPTRGKILFESKDITGKKPHAIAARGLVRTFQATNVFPSVSVLQNIVAACYLKPKFGFWEAAFHTPGSRKKEQNIVKRALEIANFVGLYNLKDTPAQSLPHGHKRTLGIAIALAAEPKLLLLDEPVTGMNAEEVIEASELIKKIWQNGTTILLIEHNMKVAMNLSQRIVVLNYGKKIAEGIPQEIQCNKDVIQAYLGTVKNATQA